jgi:hypothetical protein
MITTEKYYELVEKLIDITEELYEEYKILLEKLPVDEAFDVFLSYPLAAATDSIHNFNFDNLNDLLWPSDHIAHIIYVENIINDLNNFEELIFEYIKYKEEGDLEKLDEVLNKMEDLQNDECFHLGHVADDIRHNGEKSFIYKYHTDMDFKHDLFKVFMHHENQKFFG